MNETGLIILTIIS